MSRPGRAGRRNCTCRSVVGANWPGPSVATSAGPIVSSSIAATNPPWTTPAGLRNWAVAANATSIVPASGSIDTSSHPSRTAEGGGGVRPSIASQNGPSRVTCLFYQSMAAFGDRLQVGTTRSGGLEQTALKLESLTPALRRDDELPFRERLHRHGHGPGLAGDDDRELFLGASKLGCDGRQRRRLGGGQVDADSPAGGVLDWLAPAGCSYRTTPAEVNVTGLPSRRKHTPTGVLGDVTGPPGFAPTGAAGSAPGPESATDPPDTCSPTPRAG